VPRRSPRRDPRPEGAAPSWAARALHQRRFPGTCGGSGEWFAGRGQPGRPAVAGAKALEPAGLREGRPL